MLEITAKADLLVKKYNMLSHDDFVVVGVSGGADSMALLTYLLSKREEYNLRLLVANVEHGIRGRESIEDTEFVKNFCKDNNVEFESISINAVDEAKQNSMGVEEYSRMKRYEFFNSFNSDKIATAHNLSDNVETVLFRMSRGTSVKGLCGIPPVRENIIRPLLTCSGDEIRQACKAANIPYRTDSTNFDDAYSRNHIRQNIVPLFKKLNPSFENTVSRMIESINEDEKFIDSAVDECYADCFENNTLNVEKLNSYSTAVIKRVIVRYLSSFGVGVDDLHLKGIVNLLQSNGKFQIFDNHFVVCEKGNLRYAKMNRTVDFDSINVNKKIITNEEFLTNCKLWRKEFDFFCDCDKINGNIYIRSRKVGDTVSPAGRKCTKTLKKLYNELGINIENRASVPVICDENGVIGVYGYCVDERVKPDSSTKNILLLKILLED
ncbi:MAG: tRNA lysidine(34) synthetase TilS [Clostridia bacterium]|nr:tRNA lysidine(34) synthetase TilS [Clostridia bacterium]